MQVKNINKDTDGGNCSSSKKYINGEKIYSFSKKDNEMNDSFSNSTNKNFIKNFYLE